MVKAGCSGNWNKAEHAVRMSIFQNDIEKIKVRIIEKLE